MFAEQLKKSRQRKGLSQRGLAEVIAGIEAADVDRWFRNIKAWEQNVNEPRWSDVLRIADALGISCEELRPPKDEVANT